MEKNSTQESVHTEPDVYKRQTYDNKKELNKKQIISDYDLAMAENSLAQTKAQLAQAKAQLTTCLLYTSRNQSFRLDKVLRIIEFLKGTEDDIIRQIMHIFLIAGIKITVASHTGVAKEILIFQILSLIHISLVCAREFSAIARS